MADHITDADRQLLGELGVDTTPEDKAARTPREQRIIAGFEEIERFYDENGRAPQHGEDRDIFERLYAVRLERIRESEECRNVLNGRDKRGLLASAAESGHLGTLEDLDDATLLATLGVEASNTSDVTQIKHVRSNAERKSPDEVAQRKQCEDFELFRALFERVQADLKSGERRTIPFKGRDDQSIDKGDW